MVDMPLTYYWLAVFYLSSSVSQIVLLKQIILKEEIDAKIQLGSIPVRSAGLRSAADWQPDHSSCSIPGACHRRGSASHDYASKYSDDSPTGK